MQTQTSSNFVFNYDEADDSEIICPPKDIYDLVITKVYPMEDKPGFKASEDAEETTNTQNRITFAIENYDFDPNDPDDTDWNGVEVSDFYTWGRLYHNSGRTSQVWKADGSRGQQSKSNELLTAVLGQPWKPGISFSVDESWEGKHIRATVDRNKKGYPKVVNPMPPRKGANRTSSPAQGGVATATPAANGHEPATSMQLYKIETLWNKAELGDKDDMKRYCLGLFKTEFDSLSREQAAEWISSLDSLDIAF